MQDVNHQLFCENVLDEVLLSMRKYDEQKAEEILGRLNLLEQKENHPMSLSGGQKQRVAVAGAIASERDILVFDEPTSGLDLKHMKQVSSLIETLKTGGKTIFIISHDIEFIMKTCDYILHLDSGSVKHCGAFDKNYLLSFFNKMEALA